MHDLLQPLRDRVGIAGRLGVHAAKQRLAEVGQHAAGEAAHEPLHTDDSELEPGDTAGAPGAIEHPHPGVL
jgi:hypothetical protein